MGSLCHWGHWIERLDHGDCIIHLHTVRRRGLLIENPLIQIWAILENTTILQWTTKAIILGQSQSSFG